MAGARMVTLMLHVMSVMFHFDCLRSSSVVDAHLVVTSAPMPNIDAEGAHIQVKLDIPTLQRVLQSCPVIRRKRYFLPSLPRLPSYDPLTPEPPKVTVGYWTQGGVVRAWFKPMQTNCSYRMCLIASHDQLKCYDQKIVKNKNETVFSNVEAGTYFVWVSEERNNIFYSTKEFNVTGVHQLLQVTVGPVQEAPSLSNKTIIMMVTVGCLGVVIIITITAYFIKLKLGLHIPWCEKWLPCSKYPYQTPALTPNNAVELELETGQVALKVIPLTLPYCEKYEAAVSAVLKYLEKWANIEIQHLSLIEIYNILYRLPPTTVLVIFYSPQLEPVLNSSVITPPLTDTFVGADSLNFMHMLFSKINCKEYSKIMISFEHLYGNDNFTLFKDIQIIKLFNNDSFSTNLGNLLRLMTSADLPRGWYTNSLFSDIIEKVNVYRSQCRSSDVEFNNQYGTGRCPTHSFCMNGQHYEQEKIFPPFNNETFKANEIIQTMPGQHCVAEKWVLEQNHLRDEDFVPVESVSVCGEGNVWESPQESDNESDTLTALCRRTDRINQNYDRC